MEGLRKWNVNLNLTRMYVSQLSTVTDSTTTHHRAHKIEASSVPNYKYASLPSQRV